MISLRGARVLLIDDTLEEAIPVIKACSKRGIPVAYFDGNISDLPVETEKLTGVRLAILDMDLGGVGDTDDNKISTLVAMLQGILTADNGPYTIVAWTKHVDLVDLLQDKLFTLYQAADNQDKVPLPVICIRLEKKDFKTKADTFDVEKLSSSIEKELGKSIPLSVMQAWEERCARAASGVTNSLSEMVAPQGDTLGHWRESWIKNYFNVLTSLAKEEVGDDNLNAETFLKSLFGALNPLHVDFLEKNQLPLPDLPDGLFPLPKPSKKDSNPLAGKINTRLHISFENVDQFSPGNIYKLADHPKMVPVTPKSIFDDLIQPDLKDKDDVFNKVTPILLEVSAACDYAQAKIKLTRFIAGMIIPIEETNKFKKPDGFLLQLALFWIDKKDCLVLLSSQHAVSLDLQLAKEQMHAFARLRGQSLTYVQFWMAQQLSRPGIMRLR